MKRFKIISIACFVLLFVWSLKFAPVSNSQSPVKPERKTIPASSDAPSTERVVPTEALAAFDNVTNGFSDQATFQADRGVFEEREGIEDGIGPVYNAQSCAECHQSPITGAGSQITELRAGHFDGATFTEHPGGSLINDRSTNADIQEYIMGGNEVRTFRATTSVLGDGYVEAIDDNTLIAIANAQPGQSGGQIAGQYIMVPMLETGGMRVGRFGWKDQHASLVSFAADAYLNEMGITSPYMPDENTSNGMPVMEYDYVADPEDDGDDLAFFARFMRSTKAPPRDAALAATPNAQAGAAFFNQVGCSICHVTSITTAPVGSALNGGTFIVNKWLGSKIIHPFGDFLLHDVGTGDGIVQNGGFSTRTKLRTAPLWGLRTRPRLMHDGLSTTVSDAIMRHAGEATTVISNYQALEPTQRNQVLIFLRSL
ncbi:MAG: hypothetical protein JO360_11395 [Acidobacteria bacterium]|nr:hypothetical protein [Acidobacteriota bacterium]